MRMKSKADIRSPAKTTTGTELALDRGAKIVPVSRGEMASDSSEGVLARSTLNGITQPSHMFEQKTTD